MLEVLESGDLVGNKAFIDHYRMAGGCLRRGAGYDGPRPYLMLASTQTWSRITTAIPFQANAGGIRLMDSFRLFEHLRFDVDEEGEIAHHDAVGDYPPFSSVIEVDDVLNGVTYRIQTLRF